MSCTASALVTVGNTYVLQGTFRDPDNGDILYDPDTVTVVIRKPDGKEDTYTYGVDAALIRVQLGIYELTFEVPAVGEYTYTFSGVSAGWTGPTERSTFVACH